MSGPPNQTRANPNSASGSCQLPPPSPLSPPSPPDDETSSTTPANRCPICLDAIEDSTSALECRHTFCYECISHWVRQRNRCPLCRQLIRSIRHKVTNDQGEQVDRDEEITPPADTMGYTVDRGLFTMVFAPVDSPLYMIEPVQMGDSLLYRYSVRTLEADHMFIMLNTIPGVLFVMPDALNEVTAALHSHGITRIDNEVHRESMARHAHASFLDLHSKHAPATQARPPQSGGGNP